MQFILRVVKQSYETLYCSFEHAIEAKKNERLNRFESLKWITLFACSLFPLTNIQIECAANHSQLDGGSFGQFFFSRQAMWSMENVNMIISVLARGFSLAHEPKWYFWMMIISIYVNNLNEALIANAAHSFGGTIFFLMLQYPSVRFGGLSWKVNDRRSSQIQQSIRSLFESIRKIQKCYHINRPLH